MASQLPAFPRFVFTVLEPISLLAGFFPAVFAPAWFIAEQIAQPAGEEALPRASDNALVVAQQLGNCYGLAFLIAVAVLYTTTELKVVRSYLVALWIADIGHVAITCYGLGVARFLAFGGWNAMTWGNVGATTFLFLTRTAYLLGLFGPDALPSSSAKKSQ